jgi:putative hemolysin
MRAVLETSIPAGGLNQYSWRPASANGPRRLRGVPDIEISEGSYVARFARTESEVDRALRLRFEVFNVELGEGLDSSLITGRDEDRFDRVCMHLIVVERATGEIVGTYRLQTLETARSVDGFYCAEEFALEDLPTDVLAGSLEIGRACIARAHRNSRVLFLLWKGLAAYAGLRHKRYLFGCCSLTSQDETVGLWAEKQLQRGSHFHPDLAVLPREGLSCSAGESPLPEAEYELPTLFSTYLRFGAKVCSPPAIDRQFKTIDFLVIFDIETMDDRLRRMIFERDTRRRPGSSASAGRLT